MKFGRKGSPALTQIVAFSQMSHSCGGLINKACRLICLQSAGKVSHRPCAEKLLYLFCKFLLDSIIMLSDYGLFLHLHHFPAGQNRYCMKIHESEVLVMIWKSALPNLPVSPIVPWVLSSNAGGGVPINQEGMLEPQPNTKAIALHGLYELHTKYSPTEKHSLHTFACTVWLWCYLWSLNYHVQILCDACAQQTKTTWNNANYDFVLHSNRNMGLFWHSFVLNPECSASENSLGLEVTLHLFSLCPLLLFSSSFSLILLLRPKGSVFGCEVPGRGEVTITQVCVLNTSAMWNCFTSVSCFCGFL